MSREEPSCSVVGVLTTRFQMKIIETPVLQLLTEVLNTNLQQHDFITSWKAIVLNDGCKQLSGGLKDHVYRM